jgi:transposase
MLGIDVSKDTLACALLNPATERFHWEKTVANSPAGVDRLLAATPPTDPWVLEPTGRYSLAVAKQARAAGRVVLLAPPRKAKAYLQSLTSRAKTDRLDSQGLALFAASRPASRPLPLYPIKSEPVEQLDQRLSARRGIVEAISRLQQQRRELPHAAGPLKEAIDALIVQRKELDRQIATLTRDRSEFAAAAKLRAVDGIGPVTAAAAASRLVSRQFPRADHFVAYIGLDVGVVRSGQHKGERGLTKQGDAELRRLFYLCAQSTASRPTSPFHRIYQRELAKGRTKTAATCIVARKLARLCWSVIQHGTEYDRDRLYQQLNPPAHRTRLGQDTP